MRGLIRAGCCGWLGGDMWMTYGFRHPVIKIGTGGSKLPPVAPKSVVNFDEGHTREWHLAGVVDESPL